MGMAQRELAIWNLSPNKPFKRGKYRSGLIHRFIGILYTSVLPRYWLLVMDRQKAIRFIEKHGILLVYPIANRPEPLNLWSCFFPRTKMRWEWDSGSETQVADLWHLREELSRSQKVFYAKWYQGRATFFSLPVFQALLHTFQTKNLNERSLSSNALHVLKILEETSPLSSKELKKRTFQSRRIETKDYERALKELWNRLLITGFGEVDDGAFPSLAVGASSILFDEEFRNSENISETQAQKTLSVLEEASPFRKFLTKSLAKSPPISQKAPSTQKTIRFTDLVR